MKPSHYHTAEASRAALLAIVNANPGIVLYALHQRMEKISEAHTMKNVASLVGKMVDLHEIRRETGGVGRGGAKCSKLFARVEKTMSAEVVLAHIRLNLAGGRNGGELRPEKIMGRVKPILRVFGGL